MSYTIITDSPGGINVKHVNPDNCIMSSGVLDAGGTPVFNRHILMRLVKKDEYQDDSGVYVVCHRVGCFGLVPIEEYVASSTSTDFPFVPFFEEDFSNLKIVGVYLQDFLNEEQGKKVHALVGFHTRRTK